MVRDNNKDNFKDMVRELGKVAFAWQNFLRWEIARNSKTSRFLSSLLIGLGASFIACCLGWWMKSSVYAQSEAVIEPSSSFVFAFPWLMSGGVVSVAIGVARANYSIFKRFYDAAVSGLGLIVLSPLFLLVAILVKIDSAGPVFFKQERLGQKGRVFKMWKFRTMRHNAELETGPVWARDDDPRVTRIGQFLRKSHIDEFPQLINVVLGHMSLIGPRPERPELNEQISSHIPEFTRRLHIRPGITGLAQVRYHYGASIKDAGRKLKYDLLYIRRMCWMLDFQIFFWTLGRVLTGEGAR
jgi:lipopolysaccharide/colanic/teichoic acid biosynthesis glycosyltransferase